MNYYKGKRVVVTGASSGIGRAVCKDLVRFGASVVAIARNESKLSDLATETADHIGEIFVHPMDLRKIDDMDTKIEKIGEHLGQKVDILFNNAGSGKSAPFVQSKDHDDQETIALNLTGTILFTKKIYQTFIRPEPKDTIIAFTTSLIS